MRYFINPCPSYVFLCLHKILVILCPHFGFPLNTQNVEYNPVISPNGRYIVFQSNRPGGLGEWILASENRNYKDRTGKAIWMEPINLNELSTMGFDGPFSIQFDDEGRPKRNLFYFNQ